MRGQVASINTLHRRGEVLRHADAGGRMLVVDEAHPAPARAKTRIIRPFRPRWCSA
jgi:superfamily II DNA or RNA helicase